MCIVKLPDKALYAWWTCGGETHLTYKKQFHVPDSIPVKVTAFYQEDGINQNMGTAIFVSGKGKTSKIHLRWPTRTNVIKSQDAFVRSGAILNVSDAVDLAPKFREELSNSNVYKQVASGFNRRLAIDWQWPFLIPGQNGIPELHVEVPGWQEALCWFEWHAVGSLGKHSFNSCTPGEKLSAVGIALGAVGYLTGYNHEKVDDTSSQYGSMGTGNDCDDFAVASASVAISARTTRPGPFSCDLHKWLYHNVADVHVISGYAWPNKRTTSLGAKIKVGHMWCELTLKNSQIVIVECTSGVAFYGGTPVSDTVRSGSTEEYLSREFYWGATSSHTDKKKLDSIKMPQWYDSLSFKAPSPQQDRFYSPPGTPPRGLMVYASVPSRIDELQSMGVIKKKLLPYTKGDVQFVIHKNDQMQIDQKEKHGSFQ